MSLRIGAVLEAIEQPPMPMGALTSINSIMFVVAPAIGTPLLAQVSHLPASDWRVGVTFYVCAVLQATALIVAQRHFAVQRVAPAG